MLSRSIRTVLSLSSRQTEVWQRHNILPSAQSSQVRPTTARRNLSSAPANAEGIYANPDGGRAENVPCPLIEIAIPDRVTFLAKHARGPKCLASLRASLIPQRLPKQ